MYEEIKEVLEQHSDFDREEEDEKQMNIFEKNQENQSLNDEYRSDFMGTFNQKKESPKFKSVAQNELEDNDYDEPIKQNDEEESVRESQMRLSNVFERMNIGAYIESSIEKKP